jgi:hypothetical protein
VQDTNLFVCTRKLGTTVKTLAASATRIGLRELVIAFTFAMACLIVTASTVKAADRLDQGLKVGATIPLAMSAPDQNGDAQSLESLLGQSGLILLFTRSLDW